MSNGRHPAGPRNPRRGSRSDHEEEGDIKCTSKGCQSCTAGVIADCVAVCCCPCAVVNIMVLAFFRLPWTLGKRIFKLDNKRRKCRNKGYLIEDEDHVNEDPVSTSRKGKTVEEDDELEGIPDLVMTSSSSTTLAEMRDDDDLDEQEAWIELNHYLGFGRVSSHHSPQQQEDLHRRL